MDSLDPGLLPITKRQRLVMVEGEPRLAVAGPAVDRLDYPLKCFRHHLVPILLCLLLSLLVR